MRTCVLAILGVAGPLALSVCGCAAPARHAQRLSVPGFEEAQMLVAPSFATDAAAPEVFVHFHGAPDVMQRALEVADLPVALIVVNYRGLSGTYERAFAEPARFADLLAAALRQLRQHGRVSTEAAWGRVTVSSFSAGYGAVRAILASPDGFARVDGLILADSLYAGYADAADGAGRTPPQDAPGASGGHDTAAAGESGSGATRPTTPRRRAVNPDHVRDFCRFARQAASGRKTMLVTHSHLVPDGYAGTHETADALVACAGLERRDTAESGPHPLVVVSRAGRGRLAIYGCAGVDGPAHMQHLRSIGGWYRVYAALASGSPMMP